VGTSLLWSPWIGIIAETVLVSSVEAQRFEPRMSFVDCLFMRSSQRQHDLYRWRVQLCRHDGAAAALDVETGKPIAALPEVDDRRRSGRPMRRGWYIGGSFWSGRGHRDPTWRTCSPMEGFGLAPEANDLVQTLSVSRSTV